MKRIAASLFAGNSLLLTDTCSLTGELTQIVKLCATYLTALVDFDRVDVRRLDREDTLYAYCSGHLTYGEALLCAFARKS